MTRLQTQNLPTRIKTIKKLEGKIAVIAGGNSGRGNSKQIFMIVAIVTALSVAMIATPVMA